MVGSSCRAAEGKQCAAERRFKRTGPRRRVQRREEAEQHAPVYGFAEILYFGQNLFRGEARVRAEGIERTSDVVDDEGQTAEDEGRHTDGGQAGSNRTGYQ